MYGRGSKRVLGRAAPKKKTTAPKKRKTVRYPASSSIPRVSFRPGAGGSSVLVPFIYAEKFTINPPAAGLLGGYVFSLNNLFDPNVTGTGHQPVNYDQYALMFQTYQVYRVEAKITVWAPGSQMIVGTTISRDSTVPAAFEVALENGTSEWAGVDANGSGQCVKTFTMDIDLPSMWGMPWKEFMGDDRTRASFTGPPLEQGYLICWAADAQLGDPAAHAWAVELRYHAKLMGSKFNALS